MNLLEPRCEQQKPTLEEAEEMCRRVAVTPVEGRLDAVENVLRYLRNRTQKVAHCLLNLVLATPTYSTGLRHATD
jgi:hypothetical protein